MSKSNNNDKTTIANRAAAQIADSDATRIASTPDDITQTAGEDDATLLAGGGGRRAQDAEKKTRAEIKGGENAGGYIIGELIDDTGGEAYIRYAEKDGKDYVIKIFKSNRDINTNTEDIIASINSPYVMPILARGEIKGLHYQILPFYRNGTFSRFLSTDKVKGDKISKELLKSLIKDVNEGLHAIHGANILHNDIKPGNIFISDDFKSAVIGDFGISKFIGARTSVTNAGDMTGFYAAPESDEMNTVQGDYYSFGITVLNVAYGKNVFFGMTDKVARREILSARIPMPEKEIGVELCDLICMLTKHFFKERITYDGVCEWLKNTQCFTGCRAEAAKSAERLAINEYRFAVDGKNVNFYDAMKLAEAMNDDPSTALKHYNAGFIQNAINNSANKTLALELQEISKKYSSDPSFGLFLTLHAINPNLKIKFDGAEMNDFKDYIDVLQARYPNIDGRFLDRAFINVVLRRSNMDKKAEDLIGTILNTYRNPAELYDMLLDFFKSTKKFYYGGTVYGHFGEFLDVQAFTELGKPISFIWERTRDTFLSSLLSSYQEGEGQLDAVLSEKDKMLEYFRLGKLFSGHIPFRIAGRQVKNLYDFIDAVAYVKEGGSDIERQTIAEFLQEGGFEKIERFESVRDKNLVERVNRADNKISYIYFHCYKNAKFYGCRTIDELVSKMGALSGDEVEKTSAKLLASVDFKIWLEAQGVKI